MKKLIPKSIKLEIDKFAMLLAGPDGKKFLGYTYIILTLFTVSFFGIFAITPTLSTIASVKKQYEDNLLVRDALNKKLSNLKLLDFQYQNLQPDIQIIYDAIPETTKLPRLTRQIENIAQDNGVSILTLQSGNVEIFPNKKNDPIYAFSFQVSVSGDQTTVNNFLSDLINFDRIIGLDRITTGINEENKYTADIAGKAFFSNK